MKPEEVLKRYRKILKGEVPLQVEVAKTMEAEEKSWEEHDRLTERLRETLNEIDSGKKNFKKMENQDYSLLDLKVDLARDLAGSCEFCERKCGIDRKEELGFCKDPYQMRVASEFVHQGEEPMIIPSHTVFFTGEKEGGCNFRCVYCQNFDISQGSSKGRARAPEELFQIIKSKEERVKNLNLVGGEPTPYLHKILETLQVGEKKNPVIFNSNAYLSEKGMKLLDGVVDLYLFDFKYFDDNHALKLSKVPNYREVVTRNHQLASRQGDLLVRVLLLPNHLDCCDKLILKWIDKSLEGNLLVNVMDQYRPCWKADEYPEINRRISREEYQEAVEYAEKLGLNFIS
ncbi:hypothetical protein AKJ51_02295 [candidate division MSBL1 archaeon SCGC-AAA382A20]|uniref:Radical SAM core domain-containing protein n=1 Tax=candidate division MSBL1 archaeon SCGC-AAA382A20 TaxID=1698280 RepID=A0A133VKS0_9EURY|nr:hypothetical protein AKJ51_02295 [candidate division MSBL1 archaeon SCGC-AAA382A20]